MIFINEFLKLRFKAVIDITINVNSISRFCDESNERPFRLSLTKPKFFQKFRNWFKLNIFGDFEPFILKIEIIFIAGTSINCEITFIFQNITFNSFEGLRKFLPICLSIFFVSFCFSSLFGHFFLFLHFNPLPISTFLL